MRSAPSTSVTGVVVPIPVAADRVPRAAEVHERPALRVAVELQVPLLAGRRGVVVLRQSRRGFACPRRERVLALEEVRREPLRVREVHLADEPIGNRECGGKTIRL